ncbi:MAG: Mrp/NBP35 family ATP-binding protein [Cyanobacteria bacterium NC_groundwater_1444_Ag_S-0.65um_54_12]|nr:Mrp/NBP35 family ATP-binding protein [Cyanobacteria bacterium NC_groundwater_1444_Ag_S-0.65um_54_12]
MVTVEQIRAVLSQVMDPELDKDLVTLGMVKDIKIKETVVLVAIELTTPACPLKARIRQDVVAAIQNIPGVEQVQVDFSAQGQAFWDRAPLKGIRRTIAIGSGKGGVGKSTVAVNLALALAETGAKVGLLDADIYGPTVPLMLNVTTERPDWKDERIWPIIAYGIKVMSIGFLLPSSEDPVVWRGPMLSGALTQFLRQVEWGELDYLLIDLPPGTGDIPITLVQNIPLTGAIIVVTPQHVAAAIGTKTLRMFQNVSISVPILGILENMGAFDCPHCHETTTIFGGGGGLALAEREGVPFLGTLPLHWQLREGGDRGLPMLVSDPTADLAEQFRAIARKLDHSLKKADATAMPLIELPLI